MVARASAACPRGVTTPGSVILWQKSSWLTVAAWIPGPAGRAAVQAQAAFPPFWAVEAVEACPPAVMTVRTTRRPSEQ